MKRPAVPIFLTATAVLTTGVLYAIHATPSPPPPPPRLAAAVSSVSGDQLLADALERDALRARASRSRRTITPPRPQQHRPAAPSPPPRLIIQRPVVVPAPQPVAIPTSEFAAAQAWANGSFARAVKRCEAGGDPTIISSHSGTTYYGVWQANADFVASYDGSAASSWVRGGRFTMPESRQNVMAYRGWKARGWSPWECSRMV